MLSKLMASVSRLRASFSRGRLNDEALSECDNHIELLTERNIRAGMMREEARSAAQRQFGNVTLVREDLYQMNGFGWLDSLAQDLRYAFRGMRRSPGFTMVAVMTLALGIAVNATVFTVTNGMLFRGFPRVDPDNRLLYIDSRKGTACCVSFPDFEDWRAQAKSFDGMAVVSNGGLRIRVRDGSGLPAIYDATRLSANAFRVLDQRPILGRDFAPSDEAPGAAPVTILSYGLWVRRYGQDPGIIGRALSVDDTPTTVIGVMAPGFDFPHHRVDLWMPLRPTSNLLHQRQTRILWFAFGRVAKGVTIKSARAEMDTIGKRLSSAYPLSNQDIVPVVKNFTEFFVGPDATAIYGSMVGCCRFRAVDRLRQSRQSSVGSRGRQVPRDVGPHRPRRRALADHSSTSRRERHAVFPGWAFGLADNDMERTDLRTGGESAKLIQPVALRHR
jgi:hypothetical protein